MASIFGEVLGPRGKWPQVGETPPPHYSRVWAFTGNGPIPFSLNVTKNFDTMLRLS